MEVQAVWPKVRKGFIPLAVAAALGVILMTTRDNQGTTVRIQNGGMVLQASGTIEGTEIGVAPEILGRIKQIFVQEGEWVEAGKVVAVLEDSVLKEQVAQAQTAVAEAEARLAQAKANLEMERARVEGNIQSALANLQKVESGARPQEINEAQKNLAQAQAVFKNAEEQLRRMEVLYKQGVISEQQFQEAQTNYEVAQAKVGTAQEKLSLLLAGAREEDKLMARANYEIALAGRYQVELRAKEVEAATLAVEKAKAGWKMAQEQLDKTVIRSSVNGIVLRTNFSTGEVVNPGVPIVTLLDPSDMWLVIYVPEPAIGYVKIGQEALVTVDSFPGKTFRGRVSEIATQAEFTPKNVQTKEERVDLVFRVKITLSNEERVLKPGMPADAVVYLDAGEVN
ncbi:HlyD family secretion protein [Thermanaeromonas sp. C210]|uniref:HlyD family secretion protein n=1 Tax=Thermanaeromonas sp. C210 TaxID=2731925 RepID=UPI00155D3139|nr:HlyD family efflux transporter periplasmic adaptor subunit [Thermanaeromonas sp. C210]GFN21831.1 secretion protein HlyD [Thermanaeromonas sp. C210]